MARGRPTGTKNRNYPSLKLADALKVAKEIQDQASGMTVTRLTLAELLGVSPSSSNFRDLVASSRFYGLTTGGINADEYGLTPLGNKATGGDEVGQMSAYKEAVMVVEPYKAFFQAFKNKKVPGGAAFKEFLTKSADVPPERADECMEFILADAATAGLIRTIQGGGQYVDLSGAPTPLPAEVEGSPDQYDEVGTKDDTKADEDAESKGSSLPISRGDSKPKKVFIAHGKNRLPLDQLKTALDTFKVSYAVAVDEPNKGRPISKKVANLMQEECSSGIFIFTADERLLREGKDGEMVEVWRPSENVVYELGAASILYENRIVIFKESGVTFPTDFSDLGYIPFEKDQLVAELGNLFKELVALDILEVRAKG